MEKQNQQKRRKPDSVVAGEARPEALCEEDEGKGISRACAAPEKLVSSPEINVVDEDDDEDLQLALALSASLVESKSGSIPPVSDSYETRENSENLRLPLRRSGKGEESQKQEVLLADVAGSPKSSSSNRVDFLGSMERRAGSSTSASSRDITGVRRISTRANKNSRKASDTSESVCNKLKERRISSKCHNASTNSSSGTESGSSKVKPPIKDSSRDSVHDSFGSNSSRIRVTSGLHAVSGSLASSNSSATDEGTVPTSGFVPYSVKETSRKGVIYKENANLLGEEKQTEQIPFYRLPCSASAVRTPNWLLSSSMIGQREVLESNADDDDALCRNAFGERRRERRERRRGISSIDDDADALEEEEDMEQVFSEERIKKGLFGTQDITGRPKGSEEHHIDFGSQYSIQYALPTITCGSTLLVPNVDAAIAKQECIGSDPIVNSSSSSSFIPRSSIRGSRMSHSGSSSSSSSTTKNSSSDANRRRSNAGEGYLSSHFVAGQGSSFPSSAGGVYREEHYREGAEQEGEKRQRYAGGGFRLQQRQQPQHELHDLATRDTEPLFERKQVEKDSGGRGSSRRKSASALLQQQHPGRQQDVSLEFREQQQGAQQKPLPMFSLTPSDDSIIDAGKLNEGGGSETGAVERRRTQRRKLRGKTADGTSGKRKRKRRRTSTGEDTEDDDIVFKCENGSTVSDGTETATVIPDDEDDEETQLQVALAVSLSTADQENHPSCYTGTTVSTMSPNGSSSGSSLRVTKSGVAGGKSDNCRSSDNRSSGSNRSCSSSSSANISGAGRAHTSSGRKGERDGSALKVDEGEHSCSPSTEDAQKVPLPKFRRVSRDGEHDDSYARMDASLSDCEGSRKCGRCCSGREKACGEKSRPVEGSAEDLSEDIESSDRPSEDESPRSQLFEAEMSSVNLPAGAGVTPIAAMSTVDEPPSSHAAGSEANKGVLCDTKAGPVPAVSAESALENSSLLEDLPIGEAQTAGMMTAPGSRAAAITEVIAAAQTRGATADETCPERAGMATAETTTAGTTTAGTTTARPHSKVTGGTVVTRSTGCGAAREEADATSMQWEEVGFSGDSEENAVNGENSTDSDFEPETREEWKKKKKKRRYVQQHQRREAQHGPAQRSGVDTGHSSDSSNSSNERTSVEEEEEHDNTDDSDEDGRAKQTHGKVTRERHMQAQRQQQQQTRTYRQEHQQQRRKPQQICKTSEDGKSERRWRSAMISDMRSTINVEVEERKRLADEVKQVSVECQNDVDGAETVAADDIVSDSAATDSAANDSDVARTRMTMLRLTSGLAAVSSPSASTEKSSTVSAGLKRRPATAAASRRGKGAVAEAEAVESSDSDSEANNTHAGDAVHDKKLKGRPRRLAQQQRQNEKQELRSVSNAAATAAVKMWKHEKLHEVCLYIWAALTETISIPSKSQAAPRGNAQRSGTAERLIRAIDEQHRRHQQREQEQLEQLLQEQQQPDTGKRAEREAPGDRKVCVRMPSDSLADRHPQLQQGVPSYATSSQLSVPDTLRQRQQQQELPRREQQDKQLSIRKQGQEQQQLQQLPPPRPFLTLEQLGKVAEATGLTSLTVDDLMKMVATAAGAAGAASTAGEQQQQQRKHHAGQLTEKKGRSRKQHGYLGNDACSHHYSQALGRTTLSFEEFVFFFHYGLGLKVESNGKVW